MSKRRVSFGGVSFSSDSATPEEPKRKTPPAAEVPAKMRKNNKIIENSEFNFGTADQRADSQQFINEKGSRMKTGLHTIDSDDEEENEIQEKKENFKKLDMDLVKGVEENPDEIFDEEGNEITGFNLKDEMEEGEFDTTGQFHFNKKREDTDQWLESLDWKKIKKAETTSAEKMETENSEAQKTEEPDDKLSEKEILEQILSKMRPKETVTKALQRLGTATASKIPAWKQKRIEKLQRRKLKSAGKSDTSKYMIEDSGASEEDLKKMTDFVDHLSRRGYYDIYTDTYEKIKYKISTISTSSQDDVLDMFGEGMDKGEATASISTEKSLEDSETKWEYKIGENGKLTGPHTTTVMTKLKDEQKEGDIFCRRINSNSSFYNIKRVDFDLW